MAGSPDGPPRFTPEPPSTQPRVVGRAWEDPSEPSASKSSTLGYSLREAGRSSEKSVKSGSSTKSDKPVGISGNISVSRVSWAGRLLCLPRELDQSMWAGRGRPRTACLVLAVTAAATVLAALPLADAAWERCDSGRLDAPRFAGGGDQFREQVAAEVFSSFAATVVLAAGVFLYVRRLAASGLPVYTHSTGIYLVLSAVNFGLYCWFVGVQRCAGAEARGNSKLRAGLVILAFVCEVLAWVQLQLSILWKAQAVYGSANRCLSRQLGWSVGLFVPAWMLFAAYNSAAEPSLTLSIVTGVTWTLFVGKFAYFTFLAASQVHAAGQLLRNADVSMPNKSTLVTVLDRHAVAVVSANLTTILLFIARVTMRSMGTLAVEFIIRYVDLANNYVTVVLLSGIWRSRQHNVDAAIQIIGVWLRLDEAKSRISSELGYDIGPRMPALAEAAWISQEAYGRVLRQVKAQEPPAANHLIRMESQHLYNTESDDHPMLLPDNLVDAAQRDLKEEVEQTATSLGELQAEARTVQMALKERLAPGTDWASSKQPAKLLRGSSGFALRGVAAAYDPGIKHADRVQQKATQKYSGNFNRVRDVARLALHFDTAAALLTTIPQLVSMFDVVQVENRFATPTALGWADVTVLVRMPVERGSTMTVHIAELQLQLTSFYEARLENHKHYKIIRSVLPQLGVQPEHTDLVQNIILDALGQ